MIFFVDPNHEIGGLGLDVGYVGVEGATVGPISAEAGGDGPFVGVVEEDVTFDEVEVLVVGHGEDGEVGSVGEVGGLEVLGAFFDEALYLIYEW